MLTTIDFLRHGEVAGGSYYRGITDDPLTELGWQQMMTTIADHKWDQIVSSPLQRCLSFAQHIQQQRQSPITSSPLWQEINFGDWEGKNATQIDPQALNRFYQDPTNYPPLNGETFPAFSNRVEKGWKQIITNYPGQHILVITHAGVIRCLFSILLNLPPVNIFNLQINHASITRFQCFHDGPHNFTSLLFHNFIASNLYSSIELGNSK